MIMAMKAGLLVLALASCVTVEGVVKKDETPFCGSPPERPATWSRSA